MHLLLCIGRSRKDQSSSKDAARLLDNHDESIGMELALYRTIEASLKAVWSALSACQQMATLVDALIETQVVLRPQRACA